MLFVLSAFVEPRGGTRLTTPQTARGSSKLYPASLNPSISMDQYKDWYGYGTLQACFDGVVFYPSPIGDEYSDIHYYPAKAGVLAKT